MSAHYSHLSVLNLIGVFINRSRYDQSGYRSFATIDEYTNYL